MRTLFNKNVRLNLLSFLSLFVLLFFFSGCSTSEESTASEAENTEITHNGVSYNTVTSPYTSRIWLDRNLGASKVCEDINESACFGDYYQWGRGSDGHEKSDSNTTLGSATTVDVGDGDFLISNTSDWLDSIDLNGSIRQLLLGRSDGTSICPINFRVPTESELQLETISQGVVNNLALFNDFLKFPSAGYRDASDGSMLNQGESGHIWTNTSSTTNSYESVQMYFSATNLGFGEEKRRRGFSIRCIKDYIPNQVPVADAGEDKNITFGESITLSASESSDSDGSIVSYQWQKDGIDIGTDVNITLSSLAVGTYTYTLVVTDNDGESSSVDSVLVTVNAVSTLITHNGVTYDIVTSPFTGRVWLDRNLGARQVCTSFDDSDCYGDYYQWGRETDGHEKNTSLSAELLANQIANIGSKFRYGNSAELDWVESGVDDNGLLRSAEWSKTDGTSICPINFRVPTIDELTAETVDLALNHRDELYDSFLKIPAAGYRAINTFVDVGMVYLWSSIPTASYAYLITANTSDLLENMHYRGSGNAVRCIQDESATSNQVPTADAGENQNITFGESITLSGSGSSDSDGTIASYLWQKDGVDVGTNINLTLSSLAVGTYTYTLIVTDDDGESSSADSVVVTVSEVAVLNVGLYATGQTISQQANDDGAYLKGTVKTYTRGSDIVDDSALHIQWQDNNSNPFVNYSDAIVTCNNLSLSGYEDWRLPTIYELITIVDMSRASNTVPAVNNTFQNIAFTQGLASAYWSSTEHKAVFGTVFNLNFSHGYVDAGGIGGNMYVKCVRDTQ